MTLGAATIVPAKVGVGSGVLSLKTPAAARATIWSGSIQRLQNFNCRMALLANIFVDRHLTSLYVLKLVRQDRRPVRGHNASFCMDESGDRAWDLPGRALPPQLPYSFNRQQEGARISGMRVGK